MSGFYLVLCLVAVIGAAAEGSKCSKEAPCEKGEGDCENNDECKNGLFCGKNNCLGEFGEPYGFFPKITSKKDDCCTDNKQYCSPNEILPAYRRTCCTKTNPCPEEHGDCDTNDPSTCGIDLICGDNNCKDFHPLARETDDCCVKADYTPPAKPSYLPNPSWRRCSYEKQCGEKEGDCSGDWTCKYPLKCGSNNCHLLHPGRGIDRKMDCCVPR